MIFRRRHALAIIMAMAFTIGAILVWAGSLPNSWYQDKLSQATHTNAAGTATVAATAYKSSDQAIAAYNQVKDSVVTVQNLQKSASLDDGVSAFDNQNKDKQQTDYQTASQGSGVVVKINNGTANVVTNNHVIEGSDSIQVVDANGQKAEAKVIKVDAAKDLALIQVKSTAFKQVAKFADSSTLKSGQQIMALGSPLGTAYASTMTKGIISAPSRNLTAAQTNNQSIQVIQTDAAINPGNSGGALINLDGEVVGISSAKISASAADTTIEGMGFAIPSNTVAAFLK
ncbi:S1C family serine protease [Fructobacillus ficulneus]|uniref:Trypsin-like serine protease with PDZ domain n=1 Tax=Fructobacillus ficulneus TaxID=157463 RepID=A0A0K8MFM5_9LACO|nr:trypsin-like peptidase domain-containing protein [Fructobacillus ficulneus]GAO99341.1 trypsin-like serine protease with PDZ domain [Fructobacillus ficulneus]